MESEAVIRNDLAMKKFKKFCDRLQIYQNKQNAEKKIIKKTRDFGIQFG